MSGHSKWSTIKRQKEATDQKRGQLFSKFSQQISIAARGNPDPNANFKLRLIIDKARAINMPKENIQRAIERTKTGQSSLEELTFEGYGPSGIAILVELITDNRNRTTQEVKNLFEKGGGSLAGPGAVAYQFKKIGQILVDKSADIEKQILQMIDLGAEEVEEVSDGLEITTTPEKLTELRAAIEKLGLSVKESEIIWQPISPLVITDQNQTAKILKFMDSLEDYEDTQRVYANFDIPENVLKNL